MPLLGTFSSAALCVWVPCSQSSEATAKQLLFSIRQPFPPQAFAAAGADVLFIDALESEEEMRAFASLGGAAAGVPKVRWWGDETRRGGALCGAHLVGPLTLVKVARRFTQCRLRSST